MPKAELHTTSIKAADGSHPDAELVALCARLDTLERDYRARLAAVSSETDETELFARFCDEEDRLIERIVDLRATTLAGAAARARWLILDDHEIAPADLLASRSGNDRMLGALLRDLAHVDRRALA